jgi:hypothetical protein
MRAARTEGKAMMNARMTWAALAALVMILAIAGCGSPVDQVVKSDDLRGQMMEKITGDPAMAVDVLQRLLGSEESQGIVLDQVMGNSDALQALMARMAKDQTMVDGILNVAVQDSAMRVHVMTLFQGMQMAGGN